MDELVVMIFFLVIFSLAVAFFFLRLVSIWWQARISGAPIPFLSLIFMHFRKVSPRVIAQAYVTLIKEGIPVHVDNLEAHFMAGGNVPAITEALMIASRNNIDCDFNRVCAIDLSGRDVVEVIKSEVG